MQGPRLKLLVTNSRHPQVYPIIRALRPYAQKIVATMYGDNPLVARLSPAANSRLVDKRYYVKAPEADWSSGNIRPENTSREEVYVRTILDICEREGINAIFPSWDPKVYVFAKNRARFEERGIVIPVPGYEGVVTPLDKHRTMLAAESAGFPSPRTLVPDGEAELRDFAASVGFPVVIKSRFTTGGRGLRVVTDLPELLEEWRRAVARGSAPMLQEYIPGKDKQQFYLVLDRNGDLKVGFCPRTRLLFLRIYLNSSAVSESGPPHPYLSRAAALVHAMGWWGGVTIQTKIDPRDGLPKLMEVNPRLGHHLWYMTSLGINVPRMCLEIARGEPVEAAKDYPVGTLYLNPVEDCLHAAYALLDRAWFVVRTRWLGRRPLDPLNPPVTVRELVRCYWRIYSGRDAKRFDPYVRHLVEDPVVCVLWWLVHAKQVVQAMRHLGR